MNEIKLESMEAMKARMRKQCEAAKARGEERAAKYAKKAPHVLEVSQNGTLEPATIETASFTDTLTALSAHMEEYRTSVYLPMMNEYRDAMNRADVPTYAIMDALLPRMEEKAYTETVHAINEDTDAVQLLDRISAAVSVCVFKKVRGASDNPKLREMEKDFFRARKDGEKIRGCFDAAYGTRWVSDKYGGRRVTVIKNLDALADLNRLTRDTMGDGLDLMHEAYIAIFDEFRAACVDNRQFDFSRVYSVSVPRKRVITNEKDFEYAGAWKTVEITPIQRIFAAVRAYVTRNISTPCETRMVTRYRTVNGVREKYSETVKCISGYTYIEDYITDEYGADEVIFFRAAKYADIGGYAHDFNGSFTTYTAAADTGREVMKKREELVSMLTGKQYEVFKLRERGKGVKNICTLMGYKSKKSVNQHMDAIAVKAEKCGLCYDMLFDCNGGDPETAAAKRDERAAERETVERTAATRRRIAYAAKRAAERETAERAAAAKREAVRTRLGRDMRDTPVAIGCCGENLHAWFNCDMVDICGKTYTADAARIIAKNQYIMGRMVSRDYILRSLIYAYALENMPR